jgi:5'-phosphate synthase pdxT subunit
MDVAVIRNAFGSQIDSFCCDLTCDALPQAEKPYPGVFIRAPLVGSVGDKVEVLARLPESRGGAIVAVKQGNLLGTAFHPELTSDSRWHQLFLAYATQAKSSQ